MKLSDLNDEQREAVLEFIRVFSIDEIVHYNKLAMGEAIKLRTNAIGQNGEEFVNHVYNVSIHNNPIAEAKPEFWLLCSFISTMCKTVLKKHGIPNPNDGNYDFLELAVDLVSEAEKFAERKINTNIDKNR